ncbi:MAG: PIN domain-containing protein [Chloroflexi bacterium]|nr:PIN domain-containing protein [Chloroflexota bacterium]
MIVYIESNFVLELAFLQEEHASCDSILGLAESDKIDLVIPAFSIGEPYQAWNRRSRRRREIRERLSIELRELSYQELAGVTELLARSGEDEKRRLDELLSRLLNVASVIPIDSAVINSAIQFQNSLKLSPQDSIVYASVITHLSSSSPESKCFLNKDKRFLAPDIQVELARYNCQLIPQFSNGLRFIESRLNESGRT